MIISRLGATLPWLCILVFFSSNVNAFGSLKELEGLISQAISNNSGLKSELFLVKSKEEDLEASKWQRFPSLKAEQSTDSASDNVSTITLEQPLWLGGEISAQIDLSDAALNEQQHKYNEAGLKLAQDVAESYFEVLRFKERQKVALENQKSHEQYVATIYRRVSAKISPEADLVQARVRLQQAKRQTLNVKQELDQKTLQLERLLEAKVNDLRGVESFDVSNEILSDFENTVVSKSPTLSKLKFSIEKERKSVNLERSSLWPRIVGGVKSTNENDSGLFDDRSYFVSVIYNTGNGLSNISKVKAANIRLDSVIADYAFQKSKVKAEASQLRSKYFALKDQLAVVNDLNQESHEVLESYLRQFKVGKKSWLDVLNAQREMTESLNTQVDNVYAFSSVKFQIHLLANWPNFNISE